MSRQFAPIAARHCDYVIDNSSAFRMIPPSLWSCLRLTPTLSTDIAGLLPIRTAPRRRWWWRCNRSMPRSGWSPVVVSTYQSVSGTGEKGVRALEHEIETGVRTRGLPYAHQIAFNVLPHIDVFDEEGWSGEERKMIDETRKIMGLPDLQWYRQRFVFRCTLGHSESIYLRFARPVNAAPRAVLAGAPACVQDDPQNAVYPLAINAEGHDEVYVGRIRAVPGDDHALALWIVGDNLRKGAASTPSRLQKLSRGYSSASAKEASYA